MLTRVLLLVVLAASAALGAAPQPAAATPPARHLPGPAQGCPPPNPDRTAAPTADAPLLAVAPFRLEAARVDLHHVDLLRSNKIVSVRTRQGSKRVLQFVVGAVEITDLHQTAAADAAPSLNASTRPGSRSRLGGPVTLYVEKLCGTLTVGPLGIGFGVPGALLPPISAASPPPLVLPEVTFTNVTSYIAGLSSAQLDLPESLLCALCAG